jgi:hypothetical protein
MESLLKSKTLGIALAGALLTACSGAGGNDVPSATSVTQGSALRVAPDTSPAVLSGHYKGTFTDGAYGKGKATATYSQYQNAVGGTLSIKYANATAALSVALTANGKSIDGNSVAIDGSLYCTFSVQSTYTARNHTMSGTYSAVQGCTGDGGTFTLKQQCYYQGTGSDVRRDAGPVKPC